ncbi:hypothetical protein MKJ04_21520 [Pontibacter sp. E15-1]|uniref:hypothetical protein n=1 Tax=Pontibacter sp. E15-1 TaxID=2919918 RepID=UPI001F4F9469|nr:hypothetical protein [Pontibacter sp. E15-1]MCJ8167435.1 hypothetical protein [Pontibacter sp. E15-1]
MNVTFTASPQKTVGNCYKSTCLSAIATLRAGTQEEELVGYATIDGHMVHHVEVASAVNNGAGIFIGDYFVGFADNGHAISLTAPFIRY